MKRSIWNKIKGTYNRGMRVEGEIRHEIPAGFFLVLSSKDHVSGFLKKQEISDAVRAGYLSRERKLEEGGILTAVVEDYDETHFTLQLTLRPLYQETAIQVFNSRSVGDGVEGTVTSHVAGGAFVDIDGGGSGYIAYGQLRLPLQFKHIPIEELLHVKDRIRARITEKDRTHLRYELAVQGHDEESVAEVFPDMGVRDKTVVLPSTKESTIRVATKHVGRKILVVEDDELTLDLIQACLASAGHAVETASELGEATMKARGRTFDFIIADITMQHGLRSTTHVLSLCNPSGPPKAIFATGRYTMDDVGLIQANRRKVRQALLKPVNWDDLLSILDTFEPPDRYEFEEYVDNHEMDAISECLSVSEDELTAMSRCFESIAEHFSESGVCILKRKEGSGEFDVVLRKRLERSGLDVCLLDGRYEWKYSPLGDVVRKGQRLFLRGLSNEPGGFRKVFESGQCRFSAILGEPIVISDSPCFGVFVFCQADVDLREADREFLRIECDRLSVKVEAARIMNQLAQNHLRLSASDFLSHELGGIVMNMDVVSMVERDLRREDVSAALVSLGRVKEVYHALQDAVDLFRNIAKSTSAQKKRSLHATLHSLFRSLETRGRKYRIDMSIDVEPQLDDHQYPEAGIRQIMLNLLMNAVEQVHQSGRRFGYVKISAGMDRGNPKLPVVIRVSDSANGVHADDIERIFEPYYTTRADGTGLGLHISRRLARALGGEIKVEESWMYYGSTFTVRLPSGREGE